MRSVVAPDCIGLGFRYAAPKPHCIACRFKLLNCPLLPLLWYRIHVCSRRLTMARIMLVDHSKANKNNLKDIE